MLQLICEHCGKDFEAPGRKTNRKYCSPVCSHLAWQRPIYKKFCVICGRKFLTKQRRSGEFTKKICHRCAKTRGRLSRGKGKFICWSFGRSVKPWIAVAENKLRRKLRKGEIVHHLDLDQANNHPNNIFIYPSSGEHTSIHEIIKKLALLKLKELDYNIEYHNGVPLEFTKRD